MHDGAVQTQIEIENKFEAVDEVEVTGLESIEGVVAVAPPVEHQLDADYFDTADLRLFHAGIVLRRRLGGSDEGWHVKLRQPDGSRTEVHEPVGDSPTDVPESLRRLLVLYAHHADLVTIATIRNHRTVHLLLDDHGQPVAEVCDDHVDASSTNAPRRRGASSRSNSPAREIAPCWNGSATTSCTPAPNRRRGRRS